MLVTATDRASSVLSGIQKAIGGIGLAAGAALGSAIATTTEFASTVDDLNDRLGIGAEQTSAWVAAFELGETGIESGTKALTAFAKEIGKGGENLAEMGVKVKTATGETRPFKDLMLDVAEQFADMPDGMDKSALAMKVFGKAGQDMIPFLNRGRDGIEELLGSADELGLTLSGDLLAANDDFGIGLKRLELGFKGVQTMIGSAVIPVLASLVSHLNIAMAGVIAFIKPFAPMLGPILAVVAAIGTLVGGGAALAAIAAPIAGVLGPVIGVIAGLIGPLIAAGAAVVALKFAWDNNLGGIQQVAERVWGNVLGWFDRVRLAVLGFVDGMNEWGRGVEEALIDAFAGGKFTVILDAFHAFQQVITIVGNALKGDFSNSAIGAQMALEDLGWFVHDLGLTFQNYVIPALQNIATNVLPIATQNFNTLMGTLQTIWETVGPNLLPLLANLGATLLTLAGVIGTSLLPAWNALLPAYQQVSEAIRPLIESLLPVLAVALGVVVVGAITMLVAALNSLAGLVAGMLPGLVQAFTGAIQMISGLFDFLASAISAVVKAIGKLLEGDFLGALQELQDGSERMLLAMGRFWEGFKNLLFGLLQSLVGGVLGFFAGMAAGVFTTLDGFMAVILEEKMPNFSNGFTAFFQQLQRDAPTIVSQMATAIGTAIGNMVTDLIGAGGKIPSLITGILSALSNAVGSAGSEASRIGNAIKDGIWNAVSGLPGMISDMVWRALQDALDAVRRAIGGFRASGASVSNAVPVGAPSLAFAGLGGGSSVTVTPIDYDRLAAAMSRQEITVELDGRQVGRAVREQGARGVLRGDTSYNVTGG